MRVDLIVVFDSDMTDSMSSSEFRVFYAQTEGSRPRLCESKYKNECNSCTNKYTQPDYTTSGETPETTGMGSMGCWVKRVEGQW